jgi:hypothetical protein
MLLVLNSDSACGPPAVYSGTYSGVQCMYYMSLHTVGLYAVHVNVPPNCLFIPDKSLSSRVNRHFVKCQALC